METNLSEKKAQKKREMLLTPPKRTKRNINFPYQNGIGNIISTLISFEVGGNHD